MGTQGGAKGAQAMVVGEVDPSTHKAGRCALHRCSARATACPCLIGEWVEGGCVSQGPGCCQAASTAATAQVHDAYTLHHSTDLIHHSWLVQAAGQGRGGDRLFCAIYYQL